MAAQGRPTFERWRSYAERMDFWAATEATACNDYAEDFDPLALAHYAEFILTPRSETMKRYAP